MNKLLRNVLILISGMILLAAGIYLGLAFYFKRVFPMNTWINGIYCTGKTVEEVNKELLQYAEAPFLTIRTNKEESYTIDAEKLGLKLDYTEGLTTLLADSRNSFYWPLYVLDHCEEQIYPSMQYNKELLLNTVEDLAFVQYEIDNPGEVKIVLGSDGYMLQNSLAEHLNLEKMHTYLFEKMDDVDFLTEGIQNGSMTVDLAEGQCYEDLIPDEKQQETLRCWNNLEPFINCGIVYDMGDECIEIKGEIASSFIECDNDGNVCFDSNGQPMINTEAMEEFIYSLGDAYNTYGKELKFISTAGEEKSVPYVTYGTELDLEKEIEYLTTAFSEKKSEIHIPAYKREALVRGKNDIGDTYIEIDMGNQKLYAYEKGECIVDTDIVTGNTKRKWSTPEGVVYIYNKQRNRTLRGPGYASFVKYWMPVKGGIGLHDASWRKEFGGEIYKTNGSHGCINIPRSIMTEIYDNFEIGTPVIMFY